MNKLYIDLEKFKKAAAEMHKKYKGCPSCLGVGCLEEDFGIGKGGKPCLTCNGKGILPKD